MYKRLFISVSTTSLMCLSLISCSINPKPTPTDTRFLQAKKIMRNLSMDKKNPTQVFNYYEVLAHSLKFNLDYRIKLANSALQSGQLRLAELMMFPSLNATGSVYTRDNNFSSFGITTSGTPTDVLNSTPRTIRSGRLGLTWNILDFGASYVKAQQQGQAILIANEEARKQTQQLAQDVLVAYMNVYYAQQMDPEINELKKQLIVVDKKLKKAIKENLVPKKDILSYQYNLYEDQRRLLQLQNRYEDAVYNLKHLANLPLDQKIILDKPPVEVTQPQNLTGLDFKKLDSITLVNRPEVSGQNYQRKIAKLGINLVILQALPGIDLNGGWNYNSNKFLINRQWMDGSVDAAWNLLNLASLPAAHTTAKAKAEYEKLKWMAIVMTVLTETRYACLHFNNLNEEYALAKKQTINANEIYNLTKRRYQASIDSEQQLIYDKLRAMAAEMDEHVVAADITRSVGELYLSAGIDLLPVNVVNMPYPKLVQRVKREYKQIKLMEFKKYVDTAYNKMFTKTYHA